jgi:hypothetical protein
MWNFYKKCVKFQTWLKLEENVGHSTWRPSKCYYCWQNRFTINNFCATFRTFILLTVTFISTTHTTERMLSFYCNSGYANMQQCYIICTSSIWSKAFSGSGWTRTFSSFTRITVLWNAICCICLPTFQAAYRSHLEVSSRPRKILLGVLGCWNWTAAPLNMEKECSETCN